MTHTKAGGSNASSRSGNAFNHRLRRQGGRCPPTTTELDKTGATPAMSLTSEITGHSRRETGREPATPGHPDQFHLCR